jgi:hypothetical protein
LGLWTGAQHRCSGIIRCDFLARLYQFAPYSRPRSAVPANRVGQGHRDHRVQATGASSRTADSRTCPVSASRSSDPRGAQPIPTSSPVAVLPGHPRHAAAMAQGSARSLQGVPSARLLENRDVRSLLTEEYPVVTVGTPWRSSQRQEGLPSGSSNVIEISVPFIRTAEAIPGARFVSIKGMGRLPAAVLGSVGRAGKHSHRTGLELNREAFRSDDCGWAPVPRQPGGWGASPEEARKRKHPAPVRRLH